MINLFRLFKRSSSVNDTYKLLQSLGIGAPTASGKHVNSNSAESLPAVYCAVAAIAESVASLPIHVFKRLVDGEKQRAVNHHVEKLLNNSPNDYQCAYDFKIALMRSVLMRGNGYIHVVYDGTGKARSLHLLHPDSVIVKRLNNNRLGYQTTTPEGKEITLLQEEVIHIRYHSDDGVIGKSPIQVCRETIGFGLAQEEHGALLLKNGGMLKGVLETDNIFKDPEKGLELIRGWNKAYSGYRNSGKTALLEHGVKYKPLSISNVDAEWLASRTFTVTDVARMFKLSPIFLMDYSNSTYSNFSEAQRAYLSQSLRPWLTNLQSAFSSRLIGQCNQFNFIIEFETKDLLRATAEERFSNYDVAIRNGIMSPNEARKAENLPPRDGGDEYSQSWIQKGQVDG